MFRQNADFKMLILPQMQVSFNDPMIGVSKNCVPALICPLEYPDHFIVFLASYKRTPTCVFQLKSAQ